MKIVIKGTNLELTEALKNYATEKVSHLEHYWDEILEARIELEASTHHLKGFFRCEVNLDVPQKYVLRAEATETDMYAAIDAVVPKLREEMEKMSRNDDNHYMKSLMWQYSSYPFSQYGAGWLQSHDLG